MGFNHAADAQNTVELRFQNNSEFLRRQNTRLFEYEYRIQPLGRLSQLAEMSRVDLVGIVNNQPAIQQTANSQVLRLLIVDTSLPGNDGFEILPWGPDVS